MRIRHLFIIVLCLNMFIFCQASYAQTRRTQITNLVSFAKLGGNIRYFSPTDPVHQVLNNLGWDRIFVNSVNIALNTKDERSFADSLVNIFKPLEPSLSLSYNSQFLTQAPARETKGQVVGVQHIGMQFYSGNGNGFKSIRTNRRSLMADSELSKMDFVTIKIPKELMGEEFSIKVHYDLSDKVDFNFLKGKDTLFRTSSKLEGEGKIICKDRITLADSLINFNVTFDDFKGAIHIDSVIMINDKPIQTKTLIVTSNVNATKYEIQLRTIDKELYPEKNKIGDTLYMDLSSKLKASFPLAVFADERNTFPLTSFNEKEYSYSKGGFQKFFDGRLLDRMDVRIANVISIWNGFRFAYVYNPLNDKQEEELLVKTLIATLNTKNVEEYYTVVSKMLGIYKDAHIFFMLPEIDERRSHSVPLSVIDINGKFYVRNIHSESLRKHVSLGDEILAVDNEKISKLVKRLSVYGSGSKHNISTRLMFTLLYGEENSKTILKLRDYKTHKIKKVSTIRDFQHNPKPLTVSTLKNRDNRMLNDSTYYFNLSESKITDTLLNWINDSTKNIVFELRGYLTMDFDEKNILNKLISDTVKHNIFYRYQILSPKRKKFAQWGQVYSPESTAKKANFYFLVDKTTQSAPETFVDIVKHWKIGKIIGQATSGANGNINYLSLPGNMIVTFSGLKTLNSDGSTHHLIGIIPDYLVDFTLEDIISEKDPYILKALELINK